jgi:hypothetical protein
VIRAIVAVLLLAACSADPDGARDALADLPLDAAPPASPDASIDSSCASCADLRVPACDARFDGGPCTQDSQCPGPTNDCRHPACVCQTCGVAFAPAGTATQGNPPQTVGDCRVIQCDGTGGTRSVADDSNVPMAGMCHIGHCTNGIPNVVPDPDGTPCGGQRVCVGGVCQ